MTEKNEVGDRKSALLRRFGFLRRRSVQIGVAVVLTLLALALWPRATEVDLATAATGELVVTVDEEGQTRVRERYMVSAPVAGEVHRITLEPGDRIEAGRTVVARMRPAAPTPLDTRARAELEAAVQAAAAALARVEAERGRAATVATRARQQALRLRALQASGAVSRDAVEALEAEADAASEALQAADHAVAQARHQLAAAHARLMQHEPAPEASSPSRQDPGSDELVVLAPVDGVVLRRLRESRGVVAAGTELLELGDARGLEIVADLLSSEAVRVTPGDAVLIEQWGGGGALRGRVRRIEPAGFLKISALGVEEQRVNVIIDFEDPVEAREVLGDAYRVEVRIVIWQQPDALKLPIGSLFRAGDDWAVFVADGGRARLRTLDLGRRNSREAEVIDGLREGERVVLYPADDLEDGSRIRPREH